MRKVSGIKTVPSVFYLLLCFHIGHGTAVETPVPNDWAFVADGPLHQKLDFYMALTTDAQITEVLGFTMFTPSTDPYPFEFSEAIGSIEVTFDPV